MGGLWNHLSLACILLSRVCICNRMRAALVNEHHVPTCRTGGGAPLHCCRCRNTTWTCRTSRFPPTWPWCTPAFLPTPSPPGTARSPCACWATMVRLQSCWGKGRGLHFQQLSAHMRMLAAAHGLLMGPMALLPALCHALSTPWVPPAILARRRDQHPAWQRELDEGAAGGDEVRVAGPVGAHAAEGGRMVGLGEQEGDRRGGAELKGALDAGQWSSSAA